MLKRHLVKLLGGLLLIATLAVLSACGGKTTASSPPEAAAPAEQPAPTAAAPTATPTPEAAQPATPPPASDLLAEGKLIFMERAGGMGCQACHGIEAKGNTTVGAPDIRGRTEAEVRGALENVAMMSIVKLTDKEIEAVVAYLQYLNEQP